MTVDEIYPDRVVSEKCAYFQELHHSIDRGDFFCRGETYYKVQSVLEDGVWADDGRDSLFFRFNK